MDSVQRQRFFDRLEAGYGGRGRGKILQRLLLLALHRAGYRALEERISEWIDLEVEDRDNTAMRYAFEVRTTRSFHVEVKEQDLQQMANLPAGYRAAMAALRTGPGARWVFADRAVLLPGKLRISYGNSREWEALAGEVNRAFDAVLEEYGPAAVSEGLQGLEGPVKKALGGV